MRAALAAGLALVALALTFGASTALAAAPRVTDLHVEAPDHLTVGDHFRVVVSVEADGGSKIALAPDALPSALSLTGAASTAVRLLGGGRIVETLTLPVAAFAPGDLSIDALKLSYRGPDGSAGSLTAPSVTVHVDSVLPAGGVLNPRDLKPQAEIGAGAPGYVLPAVAAAAVVALALAALWLRRRQRQNAPAVAAPAATVAALSAEDAARGSLDGSVASLRAGDYVAYYGTIAQTVRDYLTQRFGFPAFALTTAELQAQMVRQGLDRWQARLVAGLLNQCDAVVYAQYHPAPERADADLTAAYEIVEMTRPAVEPEPATVS